MCTIFDTVSATFGANKNMATKLKNAAHTTAVCGLSTRVETTVAIELAASWKPLMTSNDSAMAMVMTTRSEILIYLRVLQDHAFDDVGDVLAAIGRVLEVLVDLLPLDDGARVLLFVEQARHRDAQDRIGLVLEAIDVDALLADGL